MTKRAEKRGGGFQQGRVTMARLALSTVVTFLVVLLALPGGAAVLSASALQTPTPTGGASSGPPSPAGAKIQLLNPSLSYDPGLDLPPRVPGDPDPPKLSDKFDGVDSLYHVVAVVSGAPSDPVIEAYFDPDDVNALEFTVGVLDPVPGSPDTYELFWDVPEQEGTGTFIVRMFTQTPSGLEEVANDQEPAELQNVEAAPLSAQAETAELTWPTQNGPLGFYKPRGGQWRTVVEGLSSGGGGEDRIVVLYSKTPPGTEPVWTACFTTNNGGARPDGSRAFSGTCALVGSDLPSQITMIAAVKQEDQCTGNCDPSGNADEFTQESADVHRVRPYLQDPNTMTIDLEPSVVGAYAHRRRRVIADRNADVNMCTSYIVTVEDHLGRPVQGPNIDIHAQGPTDQLQFGSDASTGTVNSGFKAADKGGHSSEPGAACDAFNTGTQSEQNVPGGNDLKHIESTSGAGLSGGSGVGFGQWRFYLAAFTPGMTDLTAWIDDEDLLVETEQRPADSDEMEDGEAFDTDFAQWYSIAPTVTFEPLGGTAPAGSCQRYVVRVRSGTAAVPDANVDMHVTGPEDSVDFCDPEDATPRRAPNSPPSGATQHTERDGDTGVHPNAAEADTIHTEGETNDQGNFVVGITSTVTGDSTLIAWFDGEVDEDSSFDNDEQGTDPSATVTHSWTTGTGDVEISLINPSAYGNTAPVLVSNKLDADRKYHLVARVDSPSLVSGVEFQYAADQTNFVSIGTATRIGNSDTYEFFWDTTAVAADATATVRARVSGSDVFDDRAVAVDNARETTEITRPLDGTSVSFDKRRTPVQGFAGAVAEGVEFFYTRSAAKDSPTWTPCGSVTLATGSAPQAFDGFCTLGGSDQPSQVTGIAAAGFTCDPVLGCEDPLGEPLTVTESGDAHRIFGFEANPIIAIEPAESESQTGGCQVFALRVSDQTGQPIGGLNVDIHGTGPGETVDFCDPDDGSGSQRRPPDQGGHTVVAGQEDQGSHPDDAGADTQHIEGELANTGRFTFGIRSTDAGDTALLAWVDRNDDDVQGGDEPSTTATMHWLAPDCTIEGTPGDDVLQGTEGDDRICGRGGKDTIRAGLGNDFVKGNAGDDLIKGGPGDDTLKGGRGKDRIKGGKDTDQCFGGSGKNHLAGCETGASRRMSSLRRLSYE